MTFWSLVSVARCIENRAWFYRRRVVCFLCSIVSHHVTFSIIGIEASAFTLFFIECILIYIQAACLLLGDGRVAVGTPSSAFGFCCFNLAFHSFHFALIASLSGSHFILAPFPKECLLIGWIHSLSQRFSSQCRMQLFRFSCPPN